MTTVEIFEETSAGIVFALAKKDGKYYETEIDCCEEIDCEYMWDCVNLYDDLDGWVESDRRFEPTCVRIGTVGDDFEIDHLLNIDRLGTAGNDFIECNLSNMDDASLGFIARQAYNWMHPVFFEIQHRACIRADIGEEFEHYIERCADTLGIEIYPSEISHADLMDNAQRYIGKELFGVCDYDVRRDNNSLRDDERVCYNGDSVYYLTIEDAVINAEHLYDSISNKSDRFICVTTVTVSTCAVNGFAMVDWVDGQGDVWDSDDYLASTSYKTMYEYADNIKVEVNKMEDGEYDVTIDNKNFTVDNIDRHTIRELIDYTLQDYVVYGDVIDEDKQRVINKVADRFYIKLME